MPSERLILKDRQLILVTGVGGGGKTSVCKALQEMFAVSFVSKDEIAEQFTDERGEEYQRKYRNQVYVLVRRQIKHLLATRKKNSVLVDASFWKEIKEQGAAWIEPYRLLAEQYGVRLRVIRVVLSEQHLKRNIAAKNRSYDRHKVKSPQAWRRWRREEPIYARQMAFMPPGSLIVRNDGKIEEAVERVFNWLKKAS